jgi:proteic killer suppression protein
MGRPSTEIQDHIDFCNLSPYTYHRMIKRIRHKGLERFFRTGGTRGINAQHAAWLRVLLTALNAAAGPDQMNQLPGTRLHPLRGDRTGQWAVTVSGNWRLVFEFEGEDATNIDLVDYH